MKAKNHTHPRSGERDFWLDVVPKRAYNHAVQTILYIPVDVCYSTAYPGFRQGGMFMAESKYRYWWAVVYPENMLPDWEDRIAEIVQLPFAYCVHDQDLNSDDELGKVHAHLMIMWNGPTTRKNALRVFQDLALPGKVCFHGLSVINDARNAYDYLIHDTDDARKKGKYQYPAEQRIEGNNFDIHFFEQLSLEQKAEIFEELIDNVIMQGFYNLVDLRCWVLSLEDDKIHDYLDVMRSYSAPLQRYLDGMYQKTIYCTRIRPGDSGASEENNDE